MSNSIAQFLTFLRNQYVKNLSQGVPLRIVCGNESADLDSVASAIAYAYFSYAWKPTEPVVPIISIPHHDLKLRKDVEMVLEHIGVSDKSLFFLEDLQKWKMDHGLTIDGVLVDHNELQGPCKDLIDEVVGVIDHHEDQRIYYEQVKKTNGPYIVAPTGSCSSHVVNYWNGILGSSDQSQLTDALTLCMSAIMMDTSKLKHKVEDSDMQAYAICKSVLTNMNEDAYYKRMKAAKNDVDGFSLDEILRKDYKELVFPSRSADLRVGVPTVVRSFEWMREKFGDNGTTKLWHSFLLEHKLDFLVVLTIKKANEGLKRELAIMANSCDRAQQVEFLIQSLTPELQLSKTSVFSPGSLVIETCDQRMLSASRKQIVPLLKRTVAEL
ncbi:ABL083Wp [Eremothecium gossypii ATCC 10895]|uniref:ABL083Wp n=1 Tax=Eremothecium gossypii (strain ATCC 10895 / CBS 109.51 / FGSC 9923 / NRRL Y-1056) TaxID=284811 RepID=Q75DV6_EREGS|nr:ABL083Wp [Eremothecium gossypii ATCC 10895]AAS50688.1 ABL083Wp [Eremothecium gossypii ATCC 10895]AEY94976.1 FABL083Wp [Eremothecium gossypii FDAG1]